MLIFSACLAAAASENSSFDRAVWGRGRASNQAVDNLSLCLQDQTGLAFCGLNCSNAFMRSLALVISLASRNLQNLLNSSKGKLDANFFTFWWLMRNWHSLMSKFSVALIVIVETKQWLIWSSNIWSFQTCAIIAWCLLLPQLQVSSQAQGEHKKFLHRKHHLCC